MNNQTAANRRASRRGLTLLELTISLTMTTILVLGSYGVLVMLVQGTTESQADHDTQRDIELLRQLISQDIRPGEELEFPVTDGDLGIYAGAQHRVQIQVKDYDLATDAYVTRWVRWESVQTGPTFTVRRVRSNDGVNWLAPDFSVLLVNVFTVQRQTNNRVDLFARKVDNGEIGEVDFTIALRNLP